MEKNSGNPTGRKTARRRALGGVALAILSALSFTTASAQTTAQTGTPEKPKWFVLRHDQTKDCWPALLISVNGAYQHAFARKAGGPYGSKADAMAREKVLEQEGVCAVTESR